MSMRLMRATLATIALSALTTLGGVGTAVATNDTTPPSAPKNLRVQSVSFTTATLTWSESADDSGWLQYETEVAASSQDVHRYAALEPMKSYTGLRQGLTYTASVVAVDAAHNKSAPVTLRFTTPVDTTAPSTPTSLRAVKSGGDLDVIVWNASTDNSGDVSYTLYSGSNPIYWTDDTRVSVFDLLFTLCVVNPGSTHTLTVQARDPSNHLSQRSQPLTVTFPN
jgi:hypothetical protein